MKKNAKAKNRRPQASKNTQYMRDMQELRRSSATTPVPSGKRYQRKPKHKEW